MKASTIYEDDDEQGLNAYDMALQKYNTLYKQNFQEDIPKGYEIHSILKLMSQSSLDEFHKFQPTPNTSYEKSLREYLA